MKDLVQNLSLTDSLGSQVCQHGFHLRADVWRPPGKCKSRLQSHCYSFQVEQPAIEGTPINHEKLSQWDFSCMAECKSLTIFRKV